MAQLPDIRYQLPEKCIKCSTANTFKKHISIELEPESYSVLVMKIVDVMWRKPVSTYAISACEALVALVNSVN